MDANPVDAQAWMQALTGGVLIGASAALLLAGLGRVAGISGIAGRLLAPGTERAWRVWFLAGLAVTGVVWAVWKGPAVGGGLSPSTARLVAAGLLVGVGTQLANGCTSGHGVCGLARGSVRSLVATLVFMGVAMAVVALDRHVLGVG